LAVVVALAGCGNSTFSLLTAADPAGALADSSAALKQRVVILDWSGQCDRLYPDESFAALDLTRFETTDGATLADRGTAFREATRARIEEMLNEIDVVPVRVIQHDEYTGSDEDVETTIRMTQNVSPEGRVEIGRAEYDPCNEWSDNEAVIFGEQIRRLGNGFAFEDWVTLFSNVSSHETAHTFGFGHVSRVDAKPTSRTLYVELMLDSHTMSEMRRTQRMIIEQNYCTGGNAVHGADTHAQRIVPEFSCGTMNGHRAKNKITCGCTTAE